MYGDGQDDWAYSIKLTTDGGLILAGTTKSSGAGGSDVWLIKTAPTTYTMGNITGSSQQPKWYMTFGGAQDDGSYSVVQTTDGGYAVAGFTNSTNSRGYDMWLIKTDSAGAAQWNMTYGGGKGSQANCLIQTRDGGYVLAGSTNSSASSQGVWIVKTDGTGNIEWNRVLSGESANSVVETPDGGFGFAVEYPNAFGLVKTDANGNILANETFAGPKKEASAQAIVQADDEGYALAGWVSGGNGARSNTTTSRDAWLVKTDGKGQEQWNQTYADYGVYALIKTSDGGYAMTGDRAVFIITDSSGNVLWNQLYDQQTGEYPLYFTRMQSLLEATPNHFVMAGVQDGGPYMHLQFNWIQVALKTGSQLIPPTVTILLPENSTTYGTRSVELRFAVSEPSKFLIYSVNRFLNLTATGNTTLTNLPNGDYNVTVYATDQYYNTGTSQTVFFAVNSTDSYRPPEVTIQSPTNRTYDTSQVTLTFLTSPAVFWSAYSLDGGENLTAIPNANMALVGLASGTHKLTVYSGDLPDGVVGSASISFEVSVPPIEVPYRLWTFPADANRIIPNQFPEIATATPFPAALVSHTLSALDNLFPESLLIIALAIAAVICIAVIALFRERQTK